MLAAFDEQIVWDNRATNAPADLAGAYVGKETVIRIIERWVGTWSDYRFEVEELIDAGERVLLRVWEAGRGKGSGVALERRWAMTWTLRDGRVAHVAVYDDLGQARAALVQRSERG
jgi:ketosteroid isomerase-like protein